MPRENMVKALAKVIIAAAWADGEISHDEINNLKDLLFHIPALTALQWAELDIYIESPVDETERARLLEDLRDAIASPRDKQLAIETLNEVISADGVISDEERTVFEQIKQGIETADTGLVGGLSKLIRGPINRRSTALADAPNREDHLDDFIRNKVYYHVRRRLHLGEGEINIPDDKLRKLSMAGGLMAQVAHVDKHIHEDEHRAIVEALQAGWHLSPEEAEFVAEVVASDLTKNMDFFRLAREFVEACTIPEMEAFLAVLFKIAAADGKASLEETEEIRNIARSLKLTHEQFIAAKLTVPREKRSD